MADMPSYEEKTEKQSLFCELEDGQAESFEDTGALEAFEDVDTAFQVMEYSVSVRSDLLYEALSQIDERARNVILMAFWLDMTDREISEETGLKRRTVNDIKNKTYKKLRTALEDDGHDASTFFPKGKL